jgi:hypothetical protein
MLAKQNDFRWEYSPSSFDTIRTIPETHEPAAASAFPASLSKQSGDPVSTGLQGTLQLTWEKYGKYLETLGVR